MDKFQEMTSFVAVVEAGSFVGAAEVMGLSKAAASRHVADLEQRLGARLLHRTTRRLSLTDDGQLFFARAKDILAAIGETESEISSRSGEPSGLLRINAPLTFGVMHLAPLWGRFAQLYPKVSLDIDLSDRVVDLVEEGYDLAVRITNLPSSQLVSRRLAKTRTVVCASPPYLALHGTPAHPSELARHEVISYSYFAARDEWTFTAPDDSIVVVRTHARIRANNGDTCRAAALEHQGIILQPDFLIADDLRSGDLIELLPTYRAITLGIHAVYPSRKYLPIKTRRLVDYLVEAFAVPGWNVSR
ncbi:MAG: LysR family transcriptional regulator [Rhodanobacter sp.]